MDKEKTSRRVLPHLQEVNVNGFEPSNDHDDNITKCVKSQYYIHNVEKELAEKFAIKKERSLTLAQAYFRLGYDRKAFQVSECGSFLQFAHAILPSGSVSSDGKLWRANFCRDKLCPMCAWRRSYKIFGQVSRIMDVIASQYRFLMLTLTIPNCSEDELSRTIDDMMDGWRRLIHDTKKFKDSVAGYFRALEITYNESNGTYHPHFHCILAVPLSYTRKSDLYISQGEWLSMWRKAMKRDDILIVDVRMAHSKEVTSGASESVQCISSAIAEIAKYAVKLGDDFDDDVIRCLSGALHHRRLVHFGGIFKKVASDLNLDDAEDGDLVHVDGDINGALAYMIVRYQWSCGAYKMIDAVKYTPQKGGV